MELNRLQKLAGLPLTEAKLPKPKIDDDVESGKYESSEDYENATSAMEESLKYFLKVLKSKGYKDWMSETASNYSSKFKMADYDRVVKAADDLKKAWDVHTTKMDLLDE